MKKTFRQSFVGILAFLTFAGLSLAQEPTVTFNPPSGSTVKPGTAIQLTVENPATIWDNPQISIYVEMGASLDAIQNPTSSSKSYRSGQTITLTETTTAIKAAIFVGDPDDGYSLKDGEYTDPSFGLALKSFSAIYTLDDNAGDTELPKADIPTFTPAPGAVLPGTKVRVRQINETYIAAGGTKPETGYVLNNNVDDEVVAILTINEDKTIWAFTKKEGFSNSDTVSAHYFLKSHAPSFQPAGGSLASGTLVSILADEATPNAEIFYAGGAEKKTEYVRYTAPFAIEKDTTLYAYAVESGKASSDTVEISYTVIAGKLETPYFQTDYPDGFRITGNDTAVYIDLSDEIHIAHVVDDVLIYYTTDGSTPALNEDGTPRGTTSKYTSSISFSDFYKNSGDFLTVKAFASKKGAENSDIIMATFYELKDAPDPGKATVKLIVHGENCIYQQRNQYQILLDSSHMITDYFKADLEESSLDENLLPRLYGSHTFTVPAGITAQNATTSGVPVDGTATVLVEPGTYDIFLLQSFNAEWLGKDILRGIYNGYDYPEDFKNFSLDNLKLEAGGTYIFEVAFNAGHSPYGTFAVPVDLRLTDILGEDRPSCELDSISLCLTIDNIGLKSVSQYEVYCATETDTINETVSTSLAPGERTVLTFNRKLALTNGESTRITAGIIVKDEVETANNTGEFIVFHPSTSALPATIDPMKMFSSQTKDWSYDTENKAIVASMNATAPVFSPCFHAEEAGKYRLSYEYICGRYVALPDGSVLVNNIDVYEIRVGKTYLPYESWQVVVADSTITGSSNYNEFTPKEIAFDLKEGGDYAFCIVPRRVIDEDNLKFRNMTMEKVAPFAARFNNFTVHSPRIVPQDWGNAGYKTTVNIENRGWENIENATLSISVNGTEAYRSTVSLNTNADTDLTFEVPVSGFSKDDIIRITGKILLDAQSIGEGEARPDEIVVSENTAAFDHVSDFSMVKTMQGYAGAKVGLIFPVLKKDTLTAISCGWGETQDNIDIGIAIHKVSLSGDMPTLGETVYEAIVRRGISAGLFSYNIPALLLEPGDYFISVEQLKQASFSLVMDEHPDGGFLAYDKSAEKPWKYITSAGYPVIRAVFGSNGTLKTKDAAIAAISKPIAGGIFANNEPIVVSVRNNGIETVDVPVHVRVDNTLLDSKSIKLEPYATAELTFTADLAAKDQNRNITITAFTALSGDEALSNDTLTKKVLSMVPADPYRMDFESCIDFATEGLNPAWTSVSLDRTPVAPLRHVLEGQFQYVEFPGNETDLGFIAFNPLTTEPSMVLYEFYDRCRPHSGQRFGASLGLSDDGVAKNDWLISPKLKMPSSNTQLSLWVKSFSKVYKESYEIWISEGGNDPTSEDFVRLYPAEGEELLAPTEWTQEVFDLSRYNARDIHVAIRCNTFDAPMFMIDDIVIGESAGNETDQQADFRLTVWPNPAKEMVSFVSPDADITSVAIFNLSGNMVHSASRLNTDSYRFNASGLTSGMYFVRVTTDKGTAIRKFVIR